MLTLAILQSAAAETKAPSGKTLPPPYPKQSIRERPIAPLDDRNATLAVAIKKTSPCGPAHVITKTSKYQKVCL